MARRKLSSGKQKHELAKYATDLSGRLYLFAAQHGASVAAPSIILLPGPVLQISLPQSEQFERLTGFTPPLGMVFPDGSFFVFKETVHYGYHKKTTDKPVIYRTEYSFHYQRPSDRFYFRFDHHPTKGERTTHPFHHLHSATWLPETGKLQAIPRYEYDEIDLPHVLRLIKREFLTLDKGEAF